MAQVTSGLRAVLSSPLVYEAVQTLLSTKRGRAEFVSRYLRPADGDTILDIGCGTGRILDRLPASVTYLGFDLSERYIAAARRRYGDRAQFFARSVDMIDPEQLPRFDLVLCKAVLHHISDDQVRGVAAAVSAVLHPDGRLVTLDACYAEQQSNVARFLISRDRGQNVRTSAGYERLLSEFFHKVVVHERHDLLSVPYTHAILECSHPIAAAIGDGQR